MSDYFAFKLCDDGTVDSAERVSVWFATNHSLIICDYYVSIIMKFVQKLTIVNF